MRKGIFFVFCCLVYTGSIAQYVPNNSQAFQFVSAYNPAFSGIDTYTDIKAGYRYQWAGIEGAPKSINLSINTRIKQPLDYVYNTPRSSNLKGIRIPRKKLMLHGLGVNLFNTSYGQIETIGGGLNYSVHFALSQNMRAAFGLGAVIGNTKVRLDKISPLDPDEYYNSLVANGGSTTDFNLRAGGLLYSRKFYVGFSYFPLVETALQSAEIAPGKSFYQGSAQVGFSFPVSSTIELKPSVIALLQTSNKVSVDYTAKVYLRDLLWFGASYRSVQSGVALFGLNINQTFGFAYSYEMSIGTFNQFNNGSHELILSVSLNNFRRQDPYTW
jgi:type IX secretion system PorP/SprF family membrane protein